MIKTTQIAADRAYDQTKTVLPSEMAQGIYMTHAPSLRALKLMHLMIGTAAGRMADDTTHEMRLSDVSAIDGMGHYDHQSLKPIFAELRAATITHDKPDEFKWTVGGLLDQATVDYRHEVSGDVVISWSFGRTFREMAEQSNHWAIMDRQSVFHFGSKFSVLLYQHISSLQSLKYVSSKSFSVPEIRALFGILDGKHKRFADFKHDVLQVALSEINSDLTRLNLTATYHKIGRTVAQVEIAWDVKKDLGKVRAETGKHSAGRQARLDGTVEAVALVFPSFGPIKYGPWEKICNENCKFDCGFVAREFRAFCERKNIDLAGAHIEKTFVGFCKQLKER